MSKLVPNTFQHPNLFIDKLAYYLTPAEEKVLNQAVREIMGWQDKIESRQARISLSVFMNGKEINGVRVSYGCGLCESTVRNALISLNKFGVLLKIDGDVTYDGQLFRLQDKEELIDWNALESRKKKQESKNRARTSTAREKLTGYRQHYSEEACRKMVWERDGGICRYCGNDAGGIDHIIPTIFGGKTTLENCVCACQSCNSKKGAKPLEETGMTLMTVEEVRAVAQRSLRCQTTEEKAETPLSDSNKETHVEETQEETQLPARPVRGVKPEFSAAEPPEELEYVPLDDDGEIPSRTQPRWRTPDTDWQRNFLAVCRAKNFQRKQKRKVRHLENCFAAGAVSDEPTACSKCVEALEQFEVFPEDRVIPIPPSWLEWRKEHAISHHWSVDGFIRSLMDRDALVRHCQFKSRELNASGVLPEVISIGGVPEVVSIR